MRLACWFRRPRRNELSLLFGLGNHSLMRPVPLAVAIVFFSPAVFAGEIREFDLKTIERLGTELTQESQRPDKGATSPAGSAPSRYDLRALPA